MTETERRYGRGAYHVAQNELQMNDASSTTPIVSEKSWWDAVGDFFVAVGDFAGLDGTFGYDAATAADLSLLNLGSVFSGGDDSRVVITGYPEVGDLYDSLTGPWIENPTLYLHQLNKRPSYDTRDSFALNQVRSEGGARTYASPINRGDAWIAAQSEAGWNRTMSNIRAAASSGFAGAGFALAKGIGRSDWEAGSVGQAWGAIGDVATGALGGSGFPRPIGGLGAPSLSPSARGSWIAGSSRLQSPATVQSKSVPNPYGKLGGPEHRAMVAQTIRDIQARGLLAATEYKVLTPNGEKAYRYVDVIGIDPVTSKPVEFFQIGRQTQAGLPVAREVRAINDIKAADPAINPVFVPYNR